MHLRPHFIHTFSNYTMAMAEWFLGPANIEGQCIIVAT
jgi:hypothetical protein